MAKENDKTKKRIFAFQVNYEYYKHGCESEEKTPKSVDEWLQFNVNRLKQMYSEGKLKAYEAVLHDKDIKDDGTPKAPHIHATVLYDHNYGPYSVNSVRDTFDVSSEQNITNFPKSSVSTINQVTSMIAYHQHLTNQAISDEKHVYKLEEVYFDGVFDGDVTPENAPSLAAKNLQKTAIKNSGLDKKQAVKVAGELRGVVNSKGMGYKDVVKWAENRFEDTIKTENSKSFAFLDLMKIEIDNMLDSMNELAPRVEMPKVNVFVQGNSGSGKSLLMKHLGKRVFGGNIHYMSSTSKNADGSSVTTPDPFYYYHNEQITISDEADSFEMSPQPTLSLLDRIGTVAGRGKDHAIDSLSLLAFNSAQGYYNFIQNQLAKVKGYAISNSSSRSVSMDKKLELVKADGTELEMLNRAKNTKSMLYQLERRFDYLITVGYKGYLKIQKRIVTEDSTTWSEPRFSKWTVKLNTHSDILPSENVTTIDRIADLFMNKITFENFGNDDKSNDFEYEAEKPEKKSESILGEFYLNHVKPNIQNGSVISKEILYPIYRMIEEYEGTPAKFIITSYTFEDYLFQLLKKDGWQISESEKKKFADYTELNLDMENLKTGLGVLPQVFEDTSSTNFKMTWGTTLPHWITLKKL